MFENPPSEVRSASDVFRAAVAHHQAGRLPEAELHYRQALTLKPDFAEAHNNLGVALRAQDKLEEAAASYRKAVSLKPDYAEAYNNLGVVLRKQGKLDEAVASYRKAIACKPDDVKSHYNLGNALREQSSLDEAVASYRRALTLQPNNVDVHINLGAVQKEQGRLDEAVASYQSALALRPDSAEAHANLGVMLRERGKVDEAIARLRTALALKPDDPQAHNSLGNALQDHGRLAEAGASYQHALSLQPDYVAAYHNLLYLNAYHALLDPAAYLALARGWEQSCVPAHDRQAARSRAFQNPPLSGRRLRVGYVSGDFREHAVSYFVEQLFNFHDRGRIELFAYSFHPRVDAATARCQNLAEHWARTFGMSDATMRDRIEADGIDVLVDLSGHTAHNRLGVFARRAAPVQAHYLGYFASTGLTEMDYWIGDEVLNPAADDAQFSESVWRLPRTWVSYEGQAEAPRPDQPAADATVWMGSFNNLGKLTPATLALWARVLHAVPAGRLLLKTKQLADAGNRQRIVDAMAAHGIAPDRLELNDATATSSWSTHMAYYYRLDIALDPVGGVGGGTTTCDALWMALPVVTLSGDRMASRMTHSMLVGLGHPEWVAHSDEAYIETVAALARDADVRRNLRDTQRARMAQSPLCDASDLAKALENAYFAMYARWHGAKNKPPRPAG